MKVAITGGAGFIGKKLVELHLMQGDEVRVLSRRSNARELFPSDVKVYLGDIRSDGVRLVSFVGNADVLYHCAGEMRDEQLMHDTHVHGTSNLIDAARGRIGRWVQLSSIGVYGKVEHCVVDESYPCRPIGTYEITKKCSDDLVIKAASEDYFDYVILRPSIVFGADMPNKSLRQMVRTIERGLFCFIGAHGAAANYIHADNVVWALLKCGTCQLPARQRAYIVSDHCTIEAFVRMIADALDRPHPWMRVPKWLARGVAYSLGTIPSFPLTMSRVRALSSTAIYSSDHMRRDLGYEHVLTMRDAVHKTVHAWKRSRSV